MTRQYIPYEDLKRLNALFKQEYLRSLDETLDSGWFISGSTSTGFENEFARYCGTGFCTGVNSGLDALTISLAAFGFKKGSEVIVPGLTYIAGILSVIHAGLVPVLAEPDPVTCNLTAASAERYITPKTVAIMPVHMYGLCCEMDSIAALAKTYNLKIIEDCAQAHGAEYNGKKAGNWGHIAGFSFYPTKNLGALGDGGAIITGDIELAEKCRTLRNYGSPEKYSYTKIGYNSRLDDVQAGFLSVKLRRLNAINQHKNALAEIYRAQLSPLQLTLPALPGPGNTHVYHIFNVRHPRRDVLRQYLHNEGIGSEIHYPVAPHKQAALKDYFPDAYLPITEKIHQETLSLPISYIHTPADIHKIAEAVNEFGN